MLVFERSGDLYRMTIDGSETVRLTATKAYEADPAVSADGLRLVYTRGTSRVGDELWVSDLRGGMQRRVLAARRTRYASTSDPAWSPDDRTIYVARAAQGPNEICGWIYAVRPDGSGLRRVTRGVELDGQPSPSPDGTRIAFRTGGCEPGLECCFLSVVDRRGRPTKDLARLRSTRGSQFAPSWAPDGERIAFELGDADAGWSGVYVVNRDGSRLVRVTPTRLNAEDPSWSPDGEWIAFSAWTRSSGYDLYALHPDGTGLRRLTSTRGDESSPAWIKRA